MKKEDFETELKEAEVRMENLKIELLKAAGVVDFIKYAIKKETEEKNSE